MTTIKLIGPLDYNLSNDIGDSSQVTLEHINIICDTTAGAINVYFPVLSNITGNNLNVIVVDNSGTAGTYAINCIPGSGNTFNGNSSFSIASNNQSASFSIGSTTKWTITQSGVLSAAQKTGTALTFISQGVYGTVASPETGNITANIIGAQLTVTNIVIHNNGTEPIFDAKFKRLSISGNYVIGEINYIFCVYINPTEILYSISQRT